jgi:hypothetical protein
LLFISAFLTYAMFSNANPGANTKSRLALVLSIVEHGQLRIDGFAGTTIDKAQVGGHYYSDKTPGMSLMAVPVAKLFTTLAAAGGHEPVWLDGAGRPSAAYKILLYVVGIFTSALPTALAVAVLYRVALRVGDDAAAALFAALAFGFATPAWGWATTFLGHAASGSIQFLALAALLAAADKDGQRRAFPLDLLAGALLGWSIVVEITAGPSAVMIALFRLVTAQRSAVRAGAALALGGLAAITPLLIYNGVAFGSPFKLGYGAVVGFEGMQQGFFGVRLPSLQVIWEILFGWRRGLLWVAPILLLTPAALWHLMAQSRWRPLAILIIAIAAYYVLLNSSYFYWDGGDSTGPRHLTPTLPFLCLPLCLLWRRVDRRVLAGLLALSVAATLVCAAVTMTVDASIPRPLLDHLLPAFAAGDLAGMVLHRFGVLPGHAALVPLALLWAALGAVGWQMRGRGRGVPPATGQALPQV